VKTTLLTALNMPVAFMAAGAVFAQEALVDFSKLSRSTVSDAEGNVYPTVLMGDTWWMAENLRTYRFNDGTELTHYKDWEHIEYMLQYSTQYSTGGAGYDGTRVEGHYAYPMRDIRLRSTYGLLYPYHAAVNSRGLCPAGWALADTADWFAMGRLIVGPDAFTDNGEGFLVAHGLGNFLKTDNGGLWKAHPDGGAVTGAAGMNIVPAGRLHVSGYNGLGEYAYFWTPNNVHPDGSGAGRRIILFSYDNDEMHITNFRANSPLCIRCVRKATLVELTAATPADTCRINLSGRSAEDRLTLQPDQYQYRYEDDPVPGDYHYVISGGDGDPLTGDALTDVYADNLLRPVTYHHALIHNLRYNNDRGNPQTALFAGLSEVIRLQQQAAYLYTPGVATPFWRFSGDSLHVETHDVVYRMGAIAIGGSGGRLDRMVLDMDWMDLRGSNGGIGSRDGARISAVEALRGVVSCAGTDRSLHQVQDLIIHSGTAFKLSLLNAETWGIVPPGEDVWGRASLIPYAWGVTPSYQIVPTDPEGQPLSCVRIPHGGGYSVRVATEGGGTRTYRFTAHHPEDPCFYLWLPPAHYLFTVTPSAASGPATPVSYDADLLADADLDLLAATPSGSSDAVLIPPAGSRPFADARAGSPTLADGTPWTLYTLTGRPIATGIYPDRPVPPSSASLYLLQTPSGSLLLHLRP
jgi:uncharacterized protein (TIGR02145 family)